jgi:hypothetical protein
MNKKIEQVLSSYARSFVVAVMTAYAMGDMSVKDLLIAGLIAVAGPAIRAINPKDPAFGMVADIADVQLKKLAKKSAKKK